jgi:hypothetical protein
MWIQFSEIKIGRMFHCNGNDYVKQSSRTARMLSNGRAFYFAQKELAHLVSW